jgi:hypothetical protein
VRTRSGERDNLGVNAFALEHFLPVHNVTMSLHHHIVVAWIMEAGIASRVRRQFDDAVAAPDSVEVFRRIEMVVNVNQHWICLCRLGDNLVHDDVER